MWQHFLFENKIGKPFLNHLLAILYHSVNQEAPVLLWSKLIFKVSTKRRYTKMSEQRDRESEAQIAIASKRIIFGKWSEQKKDKSSEIGFLRKAIYFFQAKKKKI